MDLNTKKDLQITATKVRMGVIDAVQRMWCLSML